MGFSSNEQRIGRPGKTEQSQHAALRWMANNRQRSFSLMQVNAAHLSMGCNASYLPREVAP